MQRKPPVYATGIPLPQLLIPEGDLKRPIAEPTTKLPVSVINSHLSNNVVNNDIKHNDNIQISSSPTKISVVDKNNNGPIPGSGSLVKFPQLSNNLFNDNIKGELDKEHTNNLDKLNELDNKISGAANVPTGTTKSQVQKISPILSTTPKVKNSSYRPPTTFKALNQTPQPNNNRPINPIVRPQNSKKQPINWSTTNRPTASYDTRGTPPLVSPGYQLRPTNRPILNGNVQSNLFEDIVTGRPGIRPGLAPKPANNRNVFDVTVSADQNYGSNNNKFPSGKELKKLDVILNHFSSIKHAFRSKSLLK